MAITRYAGDRFTIAAGDTKPTGVLDGAVLVDTGNLELYVKRNGSWEEIAGGGGGGSTSPSAPLNSVQFNNGGSFGGDADLTFTDSNRLNVNKLGISGNVYDSNNWIGEGGMILANEGATGVNWKNIESVLSGVGGSGVANYVARWSDEDTLTTGALVDNGTKVGIGTTDPEEILHLESAGAVTPGLLHDLYSTTASRFPYLGLRKSASNTAGTLAATTNEEILGKIVFKGVDSGSSYFRESASIAALGDGAPDADTQPGKLYFSTSNTSSNQVRMTIKNDGKVGIGTTAPATLLHVRGAFTSGSIPHIRSEDSTDSSYVQMYMVSSAGGYLETSSGKMLRFAPAGSTKMVVLTDGKVGIGTAAPWARFTVAGGTTSEADDFIPMSVSPSVAGGNSAGILFGVYPVGGYAKQGIFWERYASTAGYGGRGKLHFVNRDATDTSVPTIADAKMTILEDGNVGIGTNAPLNTFQIDSYTVASQGNQTVSAVSNVFANSGSDAFYMGVKNAAYPNRGWAFKTTTNGVNSDFTIREHGSTGDRLTIKTGGNVGIGTTNPGALLNVEGTVSIKGGVTWAGSDNQTAAIFLNTDNHGLHGNFAGYSRNLIKVNSRIIEIGQNSTLPLGMKFILGTASSIGYEFRTQGTNVALKIHGTTGNVGIGDNLVAPEHRLHVSGDAIISGVLYDSINSSGAAGHVFTSEVGGPQWKMIEDVLSGVGGDGTANYVPKWIDSDTIGDSLIYDDATNVGIGTTNPQRLLHVNGDAIVSGKFYDQTNSTGDKGYVLTSDDSGPLWKASGDFDGLSGNLIETGQTLTTDINAVASNLVLTGAFVDTNTLGIATNVTNISTNTLGIATNVTNISTNASNLVSTGAYLTSEIAIVSGAHTDVAELSGMVDDISGNLITTGQTLTNNLIATGAFVDTNTTNLIATGQTLTTNINGLAGNVGTTGQTLTNLIALTGTTNAAAIVTNASAIAANTSNLILTGAIVDDVSGNLITTGQYLTDEINTVSGLIPPTVVDGAGVTGYTARWFDGNTLTTGTLYDDGTNVGIGTSTPGALLETVSVTNDTAAIFESRENGGIAVVKLRVKDLSAPSSALPGDQGAALQFQGWDGNSFETMATIFAATEGTAANGDIPSNLRFLTTPDGAAAATEKMRILSDGNVGIGTTNPGYLLDLYGSFGSSAGAALRLRSSADDDLGIIWQQANGNQWFAGPETSKPDDFEFWSYNGSAWTNVLHLNQDGNVGIGTNAPNFAAAAGNTVKGLNIQNVGNDTQASLRLTGHNNTGTPGAATYTELLHAGGNLRFDINHNGTVRFSIGSGGAITFNNAYTFPTAIGTSGQVLKSPASGTTLEWSTETGPVSGSGTTNYIPKWTGGTALGNSIIYDSGGKIGIGTSTPGYKLDIWDAASAIQRFVRNDASISSNNSLGQVIFGGTEDGGTTVNLGAAIVGLSAGNWSATASGGKLVFKTTDSGTTTLDDRMIIDHDGKVGIGTDGPSAKLHVYEETANTTTASNIVRIQSHSSGTTGVGFGGAVYFLGERNGGDIQGMAKISAIAEVNSVTDLSSALTFQTATSGTNTEKVRITYDGNVGIGITNPSTKLHVNGIATTNSGGGNATLGSHLDLGDNQKARFGASDDLEIYHNASDSVIRDVGTGRLLVGASEFLVTNSALSEAQIQSLEDGAVTLYHNGAAKLATTATGITVTGGVLTDSTVLTSTSFYPLTSGMALGNVAKKWALHATTGNFSGDLRIGNNVPMWSGSYGGALVLKGNDATADRYAQLGIVNSSGTLVYTGLVVDTVGNVGIGITNPSYKLQVVGDVRVNSGHIFLDDTNKIQWGGTNARIDGSTGGDYLRFFTTNTERVRIDSSGNVTLKSGSDSTNTRHALLFQGGATNLEAKIQSGNYGSYHGGLEFWVSNQSSAGTTLTQVMTIVNEGAIQFNTYGSGTHTGTAEYKLSVDSSGNVIETAIGAGAVDGSGTANYVTKWTDGDTIGNSVIRDDGTNVGIGTTGNGYKLRVQGNVYISGTLTEASSLALKENIETYSPSLEKINKIRPVRYNKKESNKKEVGLVAEELAEMFPELVEMDKDGNPAGVNYSRAVAVLLHGFKELYKEVKELKEKI